MGKWAHALCVRCGGKVPWPGRDIQHSRTADETTISTLLASVTQNKHPCLARGKGKEASFRLSELFGTQNIPELSGSGLKSSDRNGGMTSGRTGCPWLSVCTSSQARDLAILGRCSMTVVIDSNNIHRRTGCFCFCAVVYCCYVIHGLP